ncbi:LacI family DNA-binding transcriptional regulator [Nakamurella sp. PAMC28650]|jgi:LacI family transcriptional regulator|uniref:LacI family DNA-binding transcriptional regulator n=1 Tax=Nakamurella sp. PAMC28650 TaxID=2762325 RepID=UPI00164EB5AB|nr:LacI family DNA-binding transcriptional regulator [Nakamurella sp. PAMC28650]QNK81676.1 LacI family DNA-binding transcriptional regulator [Nakamurella sp. PAMC28650]
MTGRATVYDVARVAGVSIKTVSRVVNGSEQVSEPTRQRVLSAVAELAYVRNSVAHSLRTGSGDAIGVVIDSIADSFFAMLVSVIEERMLAEGIGVLIASTGRSPSRERGQVVRLAGQNVRALVIAPIGDDHSYVTDVTEGLPVVLVDRGWEIPGYDTVVVQDRLGAKSAVDHLIAGGHRRIAFIGDNGDLPTIAERRSGYLDALAQAGIAVDPLLVRNGCGEPEPAALATAELLALVDPPSAVFSSNPRASLGVVKSLHQGGRTDIAMVSFGDFALADSLEPAVTIVNQDPTPIAEAAVDLLLARMRGQQSDATNIVLPVNVVPRGSGELVPCNR